MKLWEDPTGFEPARGSLRTWVGTLAHRRAVDHVRREEAKRRTAMREASRPAVAPDVEEMAMALVSAERVRAALDTLPDEQRDAIHRTRTSAGARTGRWQSSSEFRRARPSPGCGSG